jgi:DNA-binding transcriptional regulator YiaG
MSDQTTDATGDSRSKQPATSDAAKRPKRQFDIPVRQSVPPSFLFINGAVVQNFCGTFWNKCAHVFAPTPDETRRTLLHLRKCLHWSRPMLAGLLGISEHTLRRWEEGKRNPKGSARRLIWLIGILACTPNKLVDGFDFVTWGECTELRTRQEAMNPESEVESPQEATDTEGDYLVEFPVRAEAVLKAGISMESELQVHQGAARV